MIEPATSTRRQTRVISYFKNIAPVLFLSLIVWAGNGNSLQGDFVWDDKVYMLFNRVYSNFDLRGIFLSLGNSVEYLPVRDLSLALDFALWGHNPTGFHFTNLLIYWLTVIIVYYLAGGVITHLSVKEQSRTARIVADGMAFLTAAMFAAHPIHSEVVNFISCRNALLSGFFFFLSVWCYLHYLQGEMKTMSWYVATLATFVLSLFAKSTGIILPLIFILLTKFVHQENKNRSSLSLVPFLLVSVVGFFFFTSIAKGSNIIQRNHVADGADFILSKFAVAAQIPFFYLYKMLMPLALSPEYDVWFGHSLISPWPLICVGALLVMGGIAVWWHRKLPFFSFCFGWYVFTLIPVLNIFPTYPVVADRYAYLPSFGFCLLLASCGYLFMRGRMKLWCFSCALLLLLGLGTLSWQQNRIWNSEKSLWEHTLTVSPHAVKAYTNLGRVYFNEGNYQKAFELFYRAQKMSPTNPNYDYFHGQRFLVLNDFENAIVAFNRAVAKDATFLEAQYQLGKTYEQLGRQKEAINVYCNILLSDGLDPANFKTQARDSIKRLWAQDNFGQVKSSP